VLVRLDYGSDGLEVDLPQAPVTVIEPVFRQADPDPHGTLLAAMRAPIDSPPLRSLARAGQKVAISVCDITRAQPRREMLRAIFEEIPDIPGATSPSSSPPARTGSTPKPSWSACWGATSSTAAA
jgi:hypothetical protein